MSPLVFATLAGIAVALVSLIGIITLNRFAAARTRAALPYLVSGSAGLFAVVSITLVVEAAELLGLPTVLLLVLAGVVGLHLLTLALPESHHHHIDEECEHDVPIKPHAHRILVADAIHNIGDGIILVPAFVINPALGIAVTVGVIAHEAVQELSEFFVLRAAGLSVKRALAMNFLTALTILVGVAIGALLISFETLVAGLLAFSAGAFLYVVIKDLIPHSIYHAKQEGVLSHVTAAVIGMALMTGVTLSAPHEHAHDDDHEDQTQGYHADEDDHEDE